MYSLPFIKESDFKEHVKTTLASYSRSMGSIDLEKFNSNVVDPIKLLFDKSMFRMSYEELIKQEIYRQRDKSNTNSIGYFHQNIFRYIEGCVVPHSGWDIIFDNKVYVEMKNKHNTMNSSSSQKTYMHMQNHILRYPDTYCYLVEVIAKRSQNITWKCSLDGMSCEHEHIRRVSIDKFYAEVTGIENAFYMMCMQLPETINELINEKAADIIQKDTVIYELQQRNPDLLKALYLLAFETYEGFSELN